MHQIRRLGIYSVAGSISLMPLLVLPAMIGSGEYRHVFIFAICLLLAALMSFFYANRHALRPGQGQRT